MVWVGVVGFSIYWGVIIGYNVVFIEWGSIIV